MTIRGPVWTPRRLRWLLPVAAAARAGDDGVRSGRTQRSVAEALGVSVRTVQRWCQGTSGKASRARIPQKRLEWLLELAQPDNRLLDQEERERQFARGALERVRVKRLVPLPAWRQQEWMKPHRVLVWESSRGFQQVILFRHDARRASRSIPGEIVDYFDCSDQFEAQLIKLRLLGDLDMWRMQVPPSWVRSGRSACWMADAPLPALASYQ